MPSEKPPEWLPDGWIMTINTREDGKVDRFYSSPVSGRKFRSKGEVLRHLNGDKVNDIPPSVSDQCRNFPHYTPRVEDPENSLSWLPHGWVMEVRTRKTGEKAGSNYMCYFDPSRRYRFYCKADVFQFLEGGQRSPENGSINSNYSENFRVNDDPNSQDEVIALIERSPDGLPPGWIKELKFRRSYSLTRSDPYYTDPVSGYVFRSKKDVARFLESGAISRHAFKPKNKNFIGAVLSIESSPPVKAGSPSVVGDVVRQSIFNSPPSILSSDFLELPVEKMSFQNNGHWMRQCEGSGLNSIAAPHTPDNAQAEAPIKFRRDQGHDDVLLEKPLELLDQEVKTGHVHSHGNCSESKFEKFPDSFNTRLLKTEDTSTVEMIKRVSPRLKQLESSNPANSSNPRLMSGKAAKNRKHLAVRKSPRNKTAAKETSELSVEASLGSSQNNQPETAAADQFTKTANERMSESEAEPAQVDKIPLSSSNSSRNDHSEATDMNLTGLPASNPPDKANCETPKLTGKLPEAGDSCELQTTRSRKKDKIVPIDICFKRVTRSRSAVSSNFEDKRTSAKISKSKDVKTLSSPLRSSKRLAGMEPGPAASIESIDPTSRKMRHVASPKGCSRKRVSIESIDPTSRKMRRVASPKGCSRKRVSDSSKGPNNLKTKLEQNSDAKGKTTGKEPIGSTPGEVNQMEDNVGTLSELAPTTSAEVKHKEPTVHGPLPDEDCIGATQPDNETQDPAISLPFSDTWLDPCFEFAFKTLTGDIPGFDDVTATEEYFDKLLNSNLNSDVITPAPANNNMQGQFVAVQHPDSMNRVNTAPKIQQESSLDQDLGSSDNMNSRSKTVKVNN